MLNQGLDVGPSQTANLNGTWSNTGTLHVTGGDLNLGGMTTTAGLGMVDQDGGTVNLTGILDNTSNTLALNATTGSWYLSGGTIQGGNYSASAGAKLLMTGAGGTLDGLTAKSDLDLTQSANAHAHILNGLTLDNSTVYLGNAIGLNYGGLIFHESSTLGGTGAVVFGKSSSNYLNTNNTDFNDPSAGTLTIGSGVTVRGSAGTVGDSLFPGKIVNLGTISADDSGGMSSFDYDRNVSGGSTANTNAIIDSSGVTSPAPQLVYQSARTWGTFTYTLTGLTSGTDYTVRLHFAEILDANAGERKFHVDINGTRELADFDVVTEAGAKNKAIVREFTATADIDGNVIIDFGFGTAGFPLLNGLELLSGAVVLEAIDAGQEVGGTITVNPLISNSGTLQAKNGGVLTVNNLEGPHSGTIHAGMGSTVNISGDYTQATDGIMAIDLGGTSPELIGEVAITGTATLDGKLKVAIVNGYVPVIDDTFTPITFGALIDQFATTESTGMPAGVAVSTTHNPMDVTLTMVAALRAASSSSGSVQPFGAKLTDENVTPILEYAIDQWCSGLASASECEQLGNVQVLVTNLGSDYLGFAGNGTIWLDDDAAGPGWFIDPTPDDDSEFGEETNLANYDLLTVLLHEIGHLLGAHHTHSEDSHDGVMGEYLEAGIRHRLTQKDVEEAFADDHDWLTE